MTTHPYQITRLSPITRRALALSLGPVVALGLARFGYTVLLPAMRTDLAWTYAQAGSMNTANALGYLGGALIAAPLASPLGTQRAFRGALLLTATSLLASGLTTHFALLLVLRVLAGLGGAVIFISGATLAAHLAEEAKQGNGLALGASAYASPFVWSALLDRARGGRALALLLAVVTAGSAIPLISTSLTSALLSGILFGGASLSVVSAAMNIIRRGLPPPA